MLYVSELVLCKSLSYVANVFVSASKVTISESCLLSEFYSQMYVVLLLCNIAGASEGDEKWRGQVARAKRVPRKSN